MDDLRLKKYIKRVRLSDTEAFRKIFEFYQEGVFNFLLYRLNDIETAEDLLQEVFLKIWINRQNLDENKSIKAYIYTTANNLSLNHKRHKKVVYNYRKEYKDINKQTETPHQLLESKEFQEQLFQVIENLSDKVRIVFLMSRVEKLSYKEIADRLDISIKTVESHIVKALKQIREVVFFNKDQ